MIPLGSISLTHEQSLNGTRKKILRIVRLLSGDGILAARVASVTSQMGRSLYQSSSEARLNLGLHHSLGQVALSLIFMSRHPFPSVEMLRSFFDEVQPLSANENWHRVRSLLWLRDARFPSDAIVNQIKNIIGEKSRTELMQELEENNEKLLTSLNDLKRTTRLKEQLQEENFRMGAELDLLKAMQQLILPRHEELNSIEQLDISGFMEPADEVGGDYYDVLNTDGVITIAIGDVTGHGLESGILMVMTQAAVRTLQGIKEVDPVRFLDTLNQAIYNNVQRMQSEKNLTLAVLNYANNCLSISGQHEEIIIVRSGGKIERIDTLHLGFPIGLYHEISDFIDHEMVELHPGDGVVLYTDGITEAKNINKKQYGIERLCEIISHHWEKSAEAIQKAVIEDVYQHIGEQKVFDDITLLVVKQR